MVQHELNKTAFNCNKNKVNQLLEPEVGIIRFPATNLLDELVIEMARSKTLLLHLLPGQEMLHEKDSEERLGLWIYLNAPRAVFLKSGNFKICRLQFPEFTR